MLVFASFSSFLGYTNVLPLLPLYLLTLGVGSLQEAALWTGIILGVSPLVSAAASPLWGIMADRFGHKLVIQRSLFGFTALFIPMAFATEVWHLLALRILTGLFGGFVVQSMALASKLAPRRQLAQAIGLVQLAQLLGTAVGPLIGGFVGDRFGFAGAVLVAAAVNGLAAVAVTIWLHEPRRSTPKPGEARPSIRMLLVLAGFVPMLATIAIVRLLERSFDPLMPLLVIKLEPESVSAASLAGLIIGLGTLATAASAWLAGRLGDRSQGGRMLQVGLLLGAAACLPFAFVTSVWQVLGLRLVLGLAVGGALTLALALAAKNVPADQRGTAFGLLGGAGQYGSAVGTFGAGALASLGFELPFLTAAGLYLAAALATTVAARQRASVAVQAALRTGDDRR